MVVRSHIFRFVLVLLIIAMPVAVFGGAVGKLSGGGSSVEWTLNVSGHDKVVLSISAPDGEVYTFEYANGKAVNFNLKDLPNAVDGAYTWQLTAYPRISSSLQKQLEAARKSGDDAAARKLMRSAGIGEPDQQTGGFLVANGAIVPTDGTEAQRNPRLGGVTTNAISELPPGARTSSPARPGTPAVLDQVIPDDLIVQGSACVGLDCVNNENFGFDTIRLKENNLRIHFDDTSVSAGFAANDWRLIANGSNSGDPSKFSIEDSTSSKTPFTITAGAATNSIFADSTGRIGLRTSTPVLDLHINTSNTPAIRLEQNSSGGFTAQTWDIAGNEANFFVRDVTGGSRLPFRIRPGAATSSIDINSDGEVGIGTASPTEELTVKSDGGNSDVFVIQGSNVSSPTLFRFFETTAGQGLFSVFDENGAEAARFTAVSGGRFAIGCNAPEHDLDLGNSPGTACNAVGSRSFVDAGSTTFTASSSRTLKENIEPVKIENILDRIANVGVYNYDFKSGEKQKLGLMAEDFHTVLQRGDDKLINGQDVEMALWLAVQELTAQNKQLQDRLNALESKQQ